MATAYDCPPSSSTQDVVWDGEVVSRGTPSGLLKLLLPPSSSAGSSSFAFTLLANLRTFMAPSEVLTVLFHQTMYSQNSTAANFCRENRAKMFSAIFTLCSVWVNDFPNDFVEAEMVARLRELLELCVVEEGDAVKTALLLNALTQSLNRVARYERALGSLVGREEEVAPSDTLVGLFAISDNTALIAQQLTHIELERLSMVGLEDIVGTVAECGDLSQLGGPSSRPGVASAMAWFGRLSSLVATEVVRHSRKRVRASVAESWVEVGAACFEGGNFNSTCAIVAGLAAASVSRLKRTWSRVDRAKLDILQHQLDPSGNFLSYRSTMKAALWRAEGGSTDEEKIIIPFFLLLLKDLFLMYHSAEREGPDGQVNFEAFSSFARALRPVAEWKRRSCTAPRQPHILQYLLVGTALDDQALMHRSFECEEAENGAERELYRKLKNKTSK